MSTRLTDWVIYGSGLSALVLAEQLGSAGKDVVIVNPNKTWGGVFGGITIDGDVFDAGMTNFEFDLFGEPANDIQNYFPDNKHDVGRYVNFVERYISRFVKTKPLPTPRMLFAGHIVDDLMISNNFEVLEFLAPTVRQAIYAELQDIVAKPNPLHPRTKKDPKARIATASFEQVSLANHGPTFHGLFIEPMFKKILGISSSEIEGIFHRNGWAPLFYPETLLSQFGSAPQKLKSTFFRYPTDPNFGEFIGRISNTVRALPNVRMIVSTKETEINLAKSAIRLGSENIYFRRLAWGGEPAHLLGQSSEVMQPSKRASLDLFFLKVKEDGVTNRFAVMIDSEANSPFYRVTNQSICSGSLATEHKIILECNSVNWNEESPESGSILDEAICRYGIDPKAVVFKQHRSFNGALAIPTTVKMHEFNRLRQRVAETFHNVRLIGASSGFVSVTLNDHIIQALKIAQEEGVLS